VSTKSIFADINPLNFFEIKVEGLELVKLSIINLASNRLPSISILLILFF
jgi:hypothetical protein